MIHHFGLADQVAGHVSARDPEDPGRFWISRYGVAFDRVTPADLVAARPGETWRRESGLSPSGLHLHGALLAARPDVACAVHTHPVEAVALSALREGIGMSSQFALPFFERLRVFDYEGALTSPAECAKLAACLGGACAMILRHHGLLTVGRDVAEAMYLMYSLHQACRVELMILSGAAPSARAREIPAEVARRAASEIWDGPFPLGRAEWEAYRHL